MSPSKISRPTRLAALAVMVILLASACKVVRFDYYAFGGFTDQEADNWVEYEFGEGHFVYDGIVYDWWGNEVGCTDLDEFGYYWMAYDLVYTSEGPMFCGTA